MTTAQTQEKLTYSIDPSHSSVEFVARHMMLTKVRGRFTIRLVVANLRTERRHVKRAWELLRQAAADTANTAKEAP